MDTGAPGTEATVTAVLTPHSTAARHARLRAGGLAKRSDHELT